jgi:hypothetical protein
LHNRTSSFGDTSRQSALTWLSPQLFSADKFTGFNQLSINFSSPDRAKTGPPLRGGPSLQPHYSETTTQRQVAELCRVQIADPATAIELPVYSAVDIKSLILAVLYFLSRRNHGLP